MKAIDIIVLTFGLLLGLVTWLLLKRNKSNLKLWPRILGLGAGVYAFLVFMTASILREPTSNFVIYTITNLFLSLPFGIIGYLTGREYARRRENKK